MVPDAGEGSDAGVPSGAACDLLLQNCGATGDGCYASSLNPSGTACLTVGTTVNGGGCQLSNQCSKGAHCVGPVTSAFCRKLCLADAGVFGCATGTCVAAAGLPTGIGVCQ